MMPEHYHVCPETVEAALINAHSFVRDHSVSLWKVINFKGQFSAPLLSINTTGLSVSGSPELIARISKRPEIKGFPSMTRQTRPLAAISPALPLISLTNQYVSPKANIPENKAKDM